MLNLGFSQRIRYEKKLKKGIQRGHPYNSLQGNIPTAGVKILAELVLLLGDANESC
jgi:hypothetical protein